MNFNLFIKVKRGVCASACICMGTHSHSYTESLDGYSPNIVGIKYSRPRSFVFIFGPYPPRGRSRAGP